ncbi:hypothetical protein D9M70_586800 [compost metagenome]
MPPVPAAPGVRGSDPHTRLSIHRRKPGPGRGGDLQRLQRSPVHPRQGRVPDPVHRRDRGPQLQDGHSRSRPDAAEVADRLRLPDGRPVLLRWFHADPGAGPPEQDDWRRRAIHVHPSR